MPASNKPSLYHGNDGDYLSRWKRILHVDVRLRDGSRPSAQVLAKECGVSAKTIYRDLDALRDEIKAPVQYDAKRKGFYYSDPGFAVPAVALGERDLFALMVAENAIAQYEGTPLVDYLREAFAKVLLVLPGGVRERHEMVARAVHFSGLPATRVSPQIWTDLTIAIRSHERVELDYFVPAKGKAEPRIVDPYLLVVRDREWFLVARTQAARHYALFYLPRVRKLKRLGEFFEPASDFSAASYYEHGFNAMHGSGRPVAVELHFVAAHAHLADERAWAAKQKVTRHRDGSATVLFRSNALFEVERQVLRYGGVVEVVRPAELRSAIGAAGEKLARGHN